MAWEGPLAEPQFSGVGVAGVWVMFPVGRSVEKIRAAFKRADWLIADRYRDLRERDGEKRAHEYIARTIEKADKTVS